jgi:hypothetical protein
MNSSIRYAKHDDIDPEKWDECLDNADNRLVYAYSFYLDHMAKNWDGLILGDYEAVMPLPWNKKFGIYYLYQPPFVAMGGVFGKDLSTTLIQDFLQSIPEKFKLVEINLNPGNTVGSGHLRTNYVLTFNAAYGELYKNYRDNIKRNIKKAVEANCVFKTNIPVQDVIKLAKEQLSTVVKIDDRDWQQFEKLHRYFDIRSQATTYGVYGPNGELLASCVLFFYFVRAYYILVGNHPNGKTLGASHYLIDRCIADNAEHFDTLDFEGSDISSLAFFYESFGAKQEIYPALKIDNLPWYVKMMR